METPRMPCRTRPSSHTRRPATSPLVLFFCGALLLGAAPPALATDYYVSPAGRDSYSGLTGGAYAGDLTHPFRSLQKASDTASPGDTVYVREGRHTYSSLDNPAAVPSETVSQYSYALCWLKTNGTEARPITFANYPGERPVIAADGKRGSTFMVNADWIVIRGLTFEGSKDFISEARAKQLALRSYAHFLATGEDTVPSAEGDTVLLDERRMLSQGGVSLLQFTWGGVTQRASHVTISDCVFTKNCAAGVGILGDYVTVENCQFSDNLKRNNRGTSAVNIFQAVSSDSSTRTKIVVQNNRIWDNENLCVYYRDGKITDGNGIIVDVCNDEPGNSNYVGRMCLRNNVIYDNGGAGINVNRSDNVDVYNNTCYLNVRSPYLWNGGTIDGIPGLAPFGEIMVTTARGCNVRNNVLYGRPEPTILYQRSGANDCVWDYNVHYIQGRTDNSPTIPGRGSVCIRRDPRFTAPGTGASADFSLLSSSPAIDAGTSVRLYFDIAGTPRPQGRTTDIGAYEWVAAGVPSRPAASPVAAAPAPRRF
jgi:parallel beta-helix repeat protein